MIGKILKTMRRVKKYRQIDLMKTLNIPQNTLSQYETGYVQPTFETIEKIANSCGFKVLFVNEELGLTYSSDNIDREEI